MAGDPYWYDNVKLLLPMTGNNNSTLFTDLEFSPKTPTVFGNTKIITTQLDPFLQPTGVGYFDGNGDYMVYPYAADFDLSVQDFTIEGFFYRTSNINNALYACIFSKRVGGGNWDWGVEFNSSQLNFRFGDNSNASKRIYVGVAPLNSWHHFAVTRNGSTLRGFIDGVLGGSATISGSIKNRSIDTMVGRSLTSFDDNQYAGFMSNLRLTKGAARYLASFTPPSEPFPAYSLVISGNIIESLAATDFIIEAHNASNGVLSGRDVSSGASYTVGIKTNEKAHYVTIKPDMGAAWLPSTVYALNAKAFPTDPVSTPYYYKRLIAGTSGTTEPTWPTTPGGRCDDGGVTDAWELVERLVQPITHGPLIPS